MSELQKRTLALKAMQQGGNKFYGRNFDQSKLEEIQEAEGLDLEFELELLGRLMRNKDAKTALKAHSSYRQLLKDVRMANSVFLSMIRRPDGTVDQQATTTTLLDHMKQENENAPQAQAAHYIAAEARGTGIPEDDGDDRALTVLRAEPGAEDGGAAGPGGTGVPESPERDERI